MSAILDVSNINNKRKDYVIKRKKDSDYWRGQ